VQRTSGADAANSAPRVERHPVPVAPPPPGTGPYFDPANGGPDAGADLVLQRGLHAPPGFRLPLEPARSWLSLLGGASFNPLGYASPRVAPTVHGARPSPVLLQRAGSYQTPRVHLLSPRCAPGSRVEQQAPVQWFSQFLLDRGVASGHAFRLLLFLFVVMPHPTARRPAIFLRTTLWREFVPARSANSAYIFEFHVSPCKALHLR
jgi:hypothetical protein